MNHRPFEDWIITEQALTLAEKRDLETHLRGCKDCSALVDTGVELRSSRMVPPKAGFTHRFITRLAAHKVAERRRRFFGSLVFIVAGTVLLFWKAGPFLLSVFASPAEWITFVIGYFLFIATSIQVLTEAALVILNIAPLVVPAYVWMIILSGMAGLGLLWSVSIWRLTRYTQGV
jgi:hypothetical protein